MYKIIILILMFMVTNTTFADIYSDVQSWYGITDPTKTKNGYGDLIIDGCIQRGCTHGTYSGEYGIVALVATQIVEHGGHFCPYQLQCAHFKTERYLRVFQPIHTGNWSDKCAWLCEAGYSGTNCMPSTPRPAYCDTTPYTTNSGGRYNGIKLKTFGKTKNALTISEIARFAGGTFDPVVYLGAIKRLEHGIIASPIYMVCALSKSVSFVDRMYRGDGVEKLLCATGYTANESGTDCVPINSDVCTLQNIKICDGFDAIGYDSSIHRLEDTGKCAKFFCKEPDMAFPSLGQYTCEYCAPTVKGGQDSTNGICVKCQTGQFFDKKSNSCKKAKAFSKTDMQYGRGQTKSSRELKQQCWTMHDSIEYQNCVLGGN